MITNEKQYRITRNWVIRLTRAIEEFDKESNEHGTVDTRLRQAELEGMKSQLADLQAEMEEYERLKAADLSVISGASFEDLSVGLIRARIARNLSQRALAQRLNLKEQQIQRYEAERYASASYTRLCQIARALQVQIKNKILFPPVPDNFERLLEKIDQAGLNREFLVGRLLSSADAALADGKMPDKSNDQMLTEKAVIVLKHVYGWGYDEIFGEQKLPVPMTVSMPVRFKMPKRRRNKAANLFAKYANHLAVAVIWGMTDYPVEPIPTDPGEMRKRILDRGAGKDNLRATLHAVWDLGVVVFPLRGKGTFHGACWRHEGRNAISLKQTSKHEARWTFDLLHELYHAAQRPKERSFGLLRTEVTSQNYQESDEEAEANRFAGNVMLDGMADSLARECTQLACGAIPRLQNTVSEVAKKHGVSVGALANYLAFRLSRQNINWWGAAANLQCGDHDPWMTTRDVFIERHTHQFDNEIDRLLLMRAIN